MSELVARLRRWLAATAKSLLRPLVHQLRRVATRLDLGGAAEAGWAARTASGLRAAVAAAEVTIAEQAQTIDELHAEVDDLRRRLDELEQARSSEARPPISR